ncbi:putative flavin-containing monooxygenase 1 [Vitis vinifera]|uniref:Flavin-containing monooxygenase n=1 Tax=Vitis vinifera TaxID=29760 RepID=A0A438JTW8_VITVI|nr:putative flavin-containing monooxygenase 1 [Vitis vinifera]
MQRSSSCLCSVQGLRLWILTIWTWILVAARKVESSDSSSSDSSDDSDLDEVIKKLKRLINSYMGSISLIMTRGLLNSTRMAKQLDVVFVASHGVLPYIHDTPAWWDRSILRSKNGEEVGIIGAGISGLLACKYTLSKGYTPVVFESRSIVEDFPSHSQVLDYLQSYAHHFGLLRHIKFNSKVLSIAYEGPPEEEMQAWELWGGAGDPFALKGSGILLDVPNIPEFPAGKGPEMFHGKVIHSMEYAAMDFARAAEFIKGKRTTVVGFQKHALDIAMECSTANDGALDCPGFPTMGVHLALLYLNRFSELLIHKPGEGFLLSLLATILSPVRWGFSKFVESYIKRKLSLEKFGMVPKHSFLNQISSCLISIVPEGFYDRVEKGSILLKKAPKFGFCKEGIVVDGESTPLETDLVILATGFKGDEKLKDIFVSPTFRDYIVGSPTASLPLYRECIHPRIPQLAVIGFSESVSNLYTSEMRCRWVAELLDGRFKLPSIKEMEKDAERWDKYMKQYSGEYYRRSCIGAVHVWYNDQLCKDMGWNPKRKKGFIPELFEPYGPMDYCPS